MAAFGALVLLLMGGSKNASPSSVGAAQTPAPTPTKVVYRADQLILPPEQFPFAGYAVTADAADGATGWKREFSPSKETAATPQIVVVVRVLQATEASDPSAYLAANGICGNRSLVVLPVTEGGLVSCQSEGMHDAAGNAGQLGVLVLSQPLGRGGFAEMMIIDRYLVYVTTGWGDTATGQNGSLMSRALLTVGQTQIDIISRLAK